MSRPLALAPLGFLELAPPELIDVASAAGFADVALRVGPAVPGGAHTPLPPGSRALAETTARLDATGVGVLQVELVELRRDTDMELVRALCLAGAAVGARRLVTTGDDDDAIVAERLAEVADVAAEHGLDVDLEFMRFRRVGTLTQALAVLAAAARANTAVLVDALHLARSGGTPADVAAAPSGSVAVAQLCDARAVAPDLDALAVEAREDRLLPGEGELPLRALVDALPPSAALVVEIPTRAGAALAPAARARAGFEAAHALLASPAAQR